MNFKTLLLSSVVGITSIFGVGINEAKASTCFNVPSVRGVICNTFQGYNNRGNEVYTLGYVTDNFTSEMIVECDGYRMVQWKSNSNMSHSYNSTLANYFCGI